MIVLDQVKVLPKGATFRIFDVSDIPKLEGFIAESDGSIYFETAYEGELFHRVYSIFKVLELKAVAGPIINNKQTIEYNITVR